MGLHTTDTPSRSPSSICTSGLSLSLSLSLSLLCVCVCVLGVEGLGLRGSRLRCALLECISYMCNLSQVRNGDPKASTVKSISYICSLSKSVTRPRDPKASTVNPIRQPPTQHPGAHRLTNQPSILEHTAPNPASWSTQAHQHVWRVG